MNLAYFNSPQYRIKRSWQQFWNIFQLYQHQTRLQHLKLWAKRKRLSGVYNHYHRLHTDVVVLITNYQMRSPRLTLAADFLYDFYQQVMPNNRYQPGYAAMYKKNYRNNP